jgi:hypothetical protein
LIGAVGAAFAGANRDDESECEDDEAESVSK